MSNKIILNQTSIIHKIDNNDKFKMEFSDTNVGNGNQKTMTITGDIIPGSDGNFQLGQSGKRFNANFSAMTVTGDLAIGGGYEGGSGTGGATIYATSGNIHTDGSIIANDVTTVSDKNLKIDINDLQYNMEELRPVEFKWKNNTDNKKVFGFIAQEVQKIFPHMVKENKGFLSMDYIQIIPLCVKTIQTQKNKIDNLEEKVSELEKINQLLFDRLEKLEKKIN